MKKHAGILTALFAAIVIWAAYMYSEQPRPIGMAFPLLGPASFNVPHRELPQRERQPIGRMIHPERMILSEAHVDDHSPDVLAYAHGTLTTAGKFFIGMASKAGNPYPPNELVVFGDPSRLDRYLLISLPHAGDVETMVRDPLHDKVYFNLSANHSLELYAMDIGRYAIAPILSTTTVDVGRKPAITTDGTYIYGITDTDPSTVFKVDIASGTLMTSIRGHIPDGHSAAIGTSGSTTELYFGGGMSDGFEKADAATLAPITKTDLGPCSMSDDMPYQGIDGQGGYVYVGCESVPEGRRIATHDLSVERFSLPGNSLGLFLYGPDIYNVAQDGLIDIFHGRDLRDLERYRILDASSTPMRSKGQSVEPNELFMDDSGRLYFTAWWGVPGLYRISTSTML